MILWDSTVQKGVEAGSHSSLERVSRAAPFSTPVPAGADPPAQENASLPMPSPMPPSSVFGPVAAIEMPAIFEAADIEQIGTTTNTVV